MSATEQGLSFSIARDQQTIWKNEELHRFAVSLISHAFDVGNFTTDIVPDCDRGSGPGIAGSVIEMLKNSNLIEAVGIFNQGKFYPERLKSSRPESKGRYIGVYRLKSISLAREFLRRNQVQREVQMEILC